MPGVRKMAAKGAAGCVTGPGTLVAGGWYLAFSASGAVGLRWGVHRPLVFSQAYFDYGRARRGGPSRPRCPPGGHLK
ncbi:MAG: hypothetical protein GDA53_07515 [Rhodobacteraceae bacterium]|nr:hypothetical protein [Paracoccaceae bacterium]